MTELYRRAKWVSWQDGGLCSLLINIDRTQETHVPLSNHRSMHSITRMEGGVEGYGGSMSQGLGSGAVDGSISDCCITTSKLSTSYSTRYRANAGEWKSRSVCCSHLIFPTSTPTITITGLRNFLIMSVTTKATIASFGGKLLKLSHHASTLGCEMAFNLYLPPQATTNPTHKVPMLVYLSGLTCTPDNCSEKGFFQHGASKHGIAVLYPDTSPRKATKHHFAASFRLLTVILSR